MARYIIYKIVDGSDHEIPKGFSLVHSRYFKKVIQAEIHEFSIQCSTCFKIFKSQKDFKIHLDNSIQGCYLHEIH